MRFIEVTDEEGFRVLINVTEIQTVTAKKNGCKIVFRSNGVVYALESYEMVRKKIFSIHS
tara:strand:+ start:88 stop:267 length:180 start_codon:yes stop_codon:yes gene_type:complete